MAHDGRPAPRAPTKRTQADYSYNSARSANAPSAQKLGFGGGARDPVTQLPGPRAGDHRPVELAWKPTCRRPMHACAAESRAREMISNGTRIVCVRVLVFVRRWESGTHLCAMTDRLRPPSRRTREPDTHTAV